MLFELIEVREGEPITFQSGKRNKKQTNASSQDEKRNIIIVYLVRDNTSKIEAEESLQI